jgi:hypothetical protein
MNIGISIFSLLGAHLRMITFDWILESYNGSRNDRTLLCRYQFRAMNPTQLTYREGLPA